MKGAKESQFVLIVLLIVSLVYSGLLTFVVAADEEHSYIIFQDDFEDGDAEEWTIDVNLADAPESSWAVELDDGNHVLNMSGSLGALAGNIAWTDYTLELKVKTFTTVTDVGINFRIVRAHISYYSLQFSCDHFALKKVKPVNSPYLNSTESYLNPNTWYTITIVCIENSIKIYVDGVLRLSYLDENDPFLYGGLQVAVGGYEGAPAAMLIDDVKVFTTYHLYVTNLINKAEIEINNEKIFGADTIGAEEKLVEAQEALDNGNLSGAESLSKEAIYLAQHAPVGPVSVNELLNYPDEYNNHTVEVSGTLKGIQYDQGLYRFAVDDGIAVISVTFDGTLEEIANEDDVKVVGTFVALTQSVSASKVEKLTSPQPSPTEPEPTEPEPTEPEPTPTEPESTEPEPTEPTSPTEPSEPEPTSPSTDITLSAEWIAAILSLCGLTAGAGGWIFRSYSARKRHRILFNKLMEDIDDVYSRFRMNTLKCEAELYRYKNQVLDDFKQGLIDEAKYNILDARIDNYLKEIKEKTAEKSN